MNRLLTLSFILLFARAGAQSLSGQDSSIAVASKYKQVKISILQPRKDQISRTGPFANFTVLDERPNTIRVGFHSGGGAFSSNKPKQLIFVRPAAKEVSDFLNEWVANPGGIYKALIVIRALSISDGVLTPDERTKVNRRDSVIKELIRLKAEVYAEKDGIFVPICRYDSTERPGGMESENWGRHLSSLLYGLIDKASTLVMEPLGSKKHVTLDDICEYDRSVQDIPIIKDGISLSAGVYKDLDEFKRNAPSLDTANFMTEPDKLGLILYQKGAGQEVTYCHTLWGYCDGKTVYIMFDGILRPLWRNMHAWYFFEKETQRRTTDYSYTYPTYAYPNPQAKGSSAMVTTAMSFYPTGSEKVVTTHVRQIDLDTGNIY